MSVPPIEMLTNSTPSVAYFMRSLMGCEKKRLDRISAASVMAAGSVMNEPSSGTAVMTTRK